MHFLQHSIVCLCKSRRMVIESFNSTYGIQIKPLSINTNVAKLILYTLRKCVGEKRKSELEIVENT